MGPDGGRPGRVRFACLLGSQDINRPNALNESTLVTRNQFHIAWDSATPNFTSVRVAYRPRDERDWRISTFPFNRQNPSQRFALAASGTIDFAVSVCAAGTCSRWSKAVRASNELETFAAPENLRLTSFTEMPGIPSQVTVGKFNLSFAWDAPDHLSVARYRIAVVRKGRWSYDWVDDPTATTAAMTVFAGVGVYDAWIRQCAPRVWSQIEAGPVTCSPWGSGVRFAAPNSTPSIPTLSIADVSDRVKPFTVQWQVASANQTVNQVAYVTTVGEESYRFFEVSGEQTMYTFAVQPLAVRVRACNRAGCSGWSNDVYDRARSTEWLNAAPTPVSGTPPHIMPP